MGNPILLVKLLGSFFNSKVSHHNNSNSDSSITTNNTTTHPNKNLIILTSSKVEIIFNNLSSNNNNNSQTNLRDRAPPIPKLPQVTQFLNLRLLQDNLILKNNNPELDSLMSLGILWDPMHPQTLKQITILQVLSCFLVSKLQLLQKRVDPVKRQQKKQKK